MKVQEANIPTSQERLIDAKPQPDQRRKSAAVIVILAILLLIAICVIVFLAFFWNKKISTLKEDIKELAKNNQAINEKISTQNEDIKELANNNQAMNEKISTQNEDIKELANNNQAMNEKISALNANITDLANNHHAMNGDIENLSDSHDAMKAQNEHKEKHYNKTIAELVEDLETIVHNHTDHVDEFLDYQEAHNKTQEILERILAMPQVKEAVEKEEVPEQTVQKRSSVAATNEAVGLSKFSNHICVISIISYFIQLYSF